MTEKWKLSILEGPDRGREFDIPSDQPFIVGRGSDSDTKIRDPALSRIHCRLDIKDQQVILTDQNSSSGTFVKGIRIESPQTLLPATEFRIGDSRLLVDCESQLDAPTVTRELELGLASSKPIARSVSKTPIDSRPLHELEGETFLRYRLDKLVWTGRNSYIFKGYDTRRDRVVAVKILKPHIASTEEQRERFIRAMRTMLPVIHPNIVRTRKAGRKGPYCWTAMEWIEGQSVTKLIQNIGIGGTLAWQDVWRVAVHISRALEAAAKYHIVHRNVTPSNILRRNHDKSYLLTDLVLARALEHTDAPSLTRPGDVLGELAYMAPEILLQPNQVDQRCDQYGLGATLYALLTGDPPFKAINVSDFLEKLKTGSPKNPASVQLGMDERFCDLVMRLIKTSPEARFDSPKALLRELEHVGKLGGIEADWSDWR